MESVELPVLNFPENYSFRLKRKDDKLWIFCVIRKDWFINTPEEWVRQHFVRYLIENRNYPVNSIAVEWQLDLNNTKKRADIVVFNQNQPNLIVECKAPKVKLSQEVFEQVLRYNLSLNATYLVLTNGLNHIQGRIDLEQKSFDLIDIIPKYKI